MEASLSLENLICHLYRDDLRGRQREPDPTEGYFDYMLQVAGREGAKSGILREQIPVSLLPRDLPVDVDRKLFHERVHYWQSVSASTLQYRFTLFLDQLNIGIAKVGGRANLVCGQTQYQSEVNAELIRTSLASMDSNFRNVVVRPDMIRIPNIIQSEPFTDMPYCALPHVLGGDQVLPGYAAGLGFTGRPGAYLIPLGGYNLIESAAYVAELLYAGERIPRPQALDTEEMQIYLGPWEFWARLYEADYDSELELALSYLAAVDYTLNSDIVEPDEYDQEYSYEMSSIPYRFGKLAYRMKGERPLRCDNREPSTCVAEFQTRMAERCRWPTAEKVTRKMVVFLSRLLVKSYAHRIHSASVSQDIIQWLFESPVNDVAEHLEDLEPIWRTVTDLRNSKYESGDSFIWPLGQSIVGTMLNACVTKLRRPGEIAAPHLYHKIYKERFPLPVVLLDGKYYSEDRMNPPPEDHPYQCNATEVRFDCIGVAALSPLEDGDVGCGFVARGCGCYFTDAGLACPSEGMIRAVPATPPLSGVDTWCHWVARSLYLQTAPDTIKRRWERVERP